MYSSSASTIRPLFEYLFMDIRIRVYDITSAIIITSNLKRNVN